MKDNPFIVRPVLAICISIGIVFLGLLGLTALSIEKFPDIAPPTIRVSASYMGASAEAVQKAVVIPLEEAINGVENMIYMESTAAAGSASISITFKMGTDADQAAINVQNKAAEAQGQLPVEVTRVGVTVRKRQVSTLAILGFYSPDDSFDETFLTNYVNINVIPQIQRIEGVGDVQCMGSTYSIRIWLNPETMAHYGLVPSDISKVLEDQNTEASTGSFGEHSDNVYTYTMKYRGRYERPEEFGELVVRSTPDGEVLRLKNIAEIELGSQNYDYVGGINGHPGVTMMINQTAGSNATQINMDIEQLMNEVAQSFPPGVDYLYLQNTNDFLFASIREVVKTLLEAIVLVVLVVFFFLGDYKLTLVPTISLIVSLIGTFGIIYLLGFSLNLLTLFALVLVIGTVVDDAIVVVEAVQTKMAELENNPAVATGRAMHDISAAIVISTIVFMAVFIPVSFMSGTSGIFYKQFGLTMAAAVGISAINALSLSPALCAVFLQRKSKDGRFTTFVRKAYKASYQAVFAKYTAGLQVIFKYPWIVAGLLICAILLVVPLMRTTKTGLVPTEDTGTLNVSLNTAPGSNTQFTSGVVDKVEQIVRTYPEVKAYSRVVGHSRTGGVGSSSAMLVLRLENWNKRNGAAHSSTALMKRLNNDTKSVTDAEIFVMEPSTIDGYGTGNAVDLYLQDKKGSDIHDFYRVAHDFLSALNERPEVMQAFSAFKVDYVQYIIDVDAVKCLRDGVSPTDILDVISGYYGGIYASNIIRFSKVYRVIVQSAPQYRLDERSLDNVFFKNDDQMASVSPYITLTRTYGPGNLDRFNLFNSISANVTMAQGYSSGDVIQAIKEVAQSALPEGYGYEFGSASREQSRTNNTVFILLVCVVFIYLLLCSLYESFFIPFAVILSVPFGILGCFTAARFFGVENNIYLQTGMIMIIGLLSKTAILITEYASTRRKAGMRIQDAAFDAAKVRLRPILMTVLTMLFGMLPLLTATGAGANGNRTLGAGVVGGMLIGTLVLLFLVPSLFIFFQKLQEKFGLVVRFTAPGAPATPGAPAVIIVFAVFSGLWQSCGVYSTFETPRYNEFINNAFGTVIVQDSINASPDSIRSKNPSHDSISKPSSTMGMGMGMAFGEVHWRDFFTDERLCGLIEAALQKNVDMQSAKLHVEMAQASLKASRLAFFPALDVAPGVAYDKSWNTQLPVEASWQIDLFGGLRNARKRQQAALMQSEAYGQAVRSQLIATVTATYYTLLALDAQYTIYKLTAQNWEKNVEVMRLLMKAGKANAASVSQAEANYYDVQNNLIDIRQEIQSTENQLCSLLGEAPHPIERGRLDDWVNPDLISAGVPAQVLSARPDVRQAESELAQAFYATNEARSAFYPSITISGSYDFKSELANVVGSLFQPLFQRGALNANLKIAKTGQQDAENKFRQAIIDAGIEVNDAFIAVKSARSKAGNYTEQVKQLENTVISTKLLMKHGSTTYLEVLTAQETLLKAQINQIMNRLSEISNVITLYQALGGGAADDGALDGGVTD